MKPPQRNKIKLVASVRKLQAGEEKAMGEAELKTDEKLGKVIIGNHSFSFDRVISKDEGMLDYMILPTVNSFFKGANPIILAYGQTGSGKNCLMGTNLQNSSDPVSQVLTLETGVIHQVGDELFSKLEENYKLSASFFEVVGDSSFDLLKGNSNRVPINLTLEGGIIVDGPTLHALRDKKDLNELLKNGLSRRRRDNVKDINRSHLILTINLDTPSEKRHKSTFYLAILAGYGDPKSTGSVDGNVVKVNTTMLAIETALMKLKYKDPNPIINAPPKDLLSQLLKYPLRGDGEKFMFACLSPAAVDSGQTLSTATFAMDLKHLGSTQLVGVDHPEPITSSQKPGPTKPEHEHDVPPPETYVPSPAEEGGTSIHDSAEYGFDDDNLESRLRDLNLHEMDEKWRQGVSNFKLSLGNYDSIKKGTVPERRGRRQKRWNFTKLMEVYDATLDLFEDSAIFIKDFKNLLKDAENFEEKQSCLLYAINELNNIQLAKLPITQYGLWSSVVSVPEAKNLIIYALFSTFTTRDRVRVAENQTTSNSSMEAEKATEQFKDYMTNVIRAEKRHQGVKNIRAYIIDFDAFVKKHEPIYSEQVKEIIQSIINQIRNNEEISESRLEFFNLCTELATLRIKIRDERVSGAEIARLQADLENKRTSMLQMMDTTSLVTEYFDWPVDTKGSKRHNVLTLCKEILQKIFLMAHEYRVRLRVAEEGNAAVAFNPEWSAGLNNMGNTCYLNSAIQCLHSIPELRNALALYTSSDVDQSLTVEVKKLFERLDKSVNPVAPTELLDALRNKYSGFADKNNGTYVQQDAHECWTVILSELLYSLKSPSSSEGDDNMKRLFGIVLTSELHCVESGQITPSSSDTLHTLKCYISEEVNYLHEGLKREFESDYETDRAKYIKRSWITDLPRYLTVQLARTSWNADTQRNEKITRMVDCPLVFDVKRFCSADLCRRLDDIRKGPSANGSQDSSESVVAGEGFKHLTVEYDLVAVLTHRGENANSGHYVAWVKQLNGEWILFDDENSIPKQTEDISKLWGGGADEHMAYVCVYKSRDTSI